MDLGVIGLGYLGQQFARALTSAGHQVTVYDRNPNRYAALADTSVVFAESVQQASSGRDAVLTLLPGTAEVRQVIGGVDGILTTTPAPTAVINCSTISHSGTLELATQCASAGIDFVDAPVTGSPPEAVFFVGGTDATITAVEPVFSAVGHSAVRLGIAGDGTAGKLVNQQILYGTYLAIFEALVVAAKAGLSTADLAAAITAGPAASRALTAVSQRILSSDLSDNRGAPLSLIAKDMQLLHELTSALHVDSAIAEKLATASADAVQHGLGDQHFGILMHTIADRNDVKIPFGHEPTSCPPDPTGLVRRFIALWNAGTPDKLDEVLDPDFIWRSLDGRVVEGRTAYIAMVCGRSHGHLTIDIDKLVTESDHVLARLHIRRGDGTSFHTHDLFRIAHHRIVEEWSGHV